MANNSAINKFMLYAALASLSMILLLAAACEVSRRMCWIESTFQGCSDSILPRNDIVAQWMKVNSGRRMNEAESFGSMSFFSSNESSTESTSSLACEDIFLHALQHTKRLRDQLRESSISSNIQQVDYDQALCLYAQSCDGDWPSTSLLPLILCHGMDLRTHDMLNNTNVSITQNKSNSTLTQDIFIYIILPPLLLLYLLLLFRLLATTADKYFSPALETFSFELGLPPRFAGATLLALGNGSPDLGSTVNSILLWNDVGITNAPYGSGAGWTMSLGSLTGGGMFVGTVVSGLIVQSCNGIPCRGAFLRDVAMYATSVFVVWQVLESGSVTRSDVFLMVGMWLAYVSMIFCSDMYHRKVTLPRLLKERKLQRETLLLERAERMSVANSARDKNDNNVIVNESTPLGKIQRYSEDYDRDTDGSKLDVDEDMYMTAVKDLTSLESLSIPEQKILPRFSVADRFALLMSNYDQASVKFDLTSRSSTVSNDDSELDKIHSMIEHIHCNRRTSFALPSKENDIEIEQMSAPLPLKLSTYSEECEEEKSVIDEGRERVCSFGLFSDAIQEILFQTREHFVSGFFEEPSKFERAAFILELPFVVLRTVTIPVPCEDHYNRVIVALSSALSTLWVLWYSDTCFTFVGTIYTVTMLLISLSILRFASDDKLSLLVAAPLSLYGFFIAATWINVIGQYLVNLLQFFGTISHIPAPILGVTVLAWGNSLGDLSANVAMATKGMPDMATTANFAGPSFNLLVGVGIGFLFLQNKLDSSTVSPVSLTPSIRIGFSFVMMNCLLIVLCGSFCHWRIPYQYSYVFFTLYGLFIFMSLTTLFH